MLLVVKPGQTVTVDDIVTDTGLSPEMVRLVLNGLTKAGLFEERDHTVFFRRSLFRRVMAAASVA